MANEDITYYLANLVLVSRIDGRLDPQEKEAVENICTELGARESDLAEAVKVVEKGNYRPTPVGRFCDKVRNLEDMIYISVSDGELPDTQKKTILSFAKQIKVNQEQINEMLDEAKQRLRLYRGETDCPSCRKQIPPDSKFCPFCGVKT